MKRIVLYSLLIAILVTLAVPTLGSVCAQEVNASLTVTKTGTPLTQSAPGTITWNVTITNTGDVPLTGVNVTDSRHGVLGSLGSLAPGGFAYWTIVESDLPSGTYTDQAFAAGYYGPENLTVIAFSDLVECVVTPPNASISFSKTPSATKVVAGSSVSYLYNVTNTGETALTGGIYDDVFGSVGSYVDLQPGGWVGFNVTHVITANTTNVATAYGVDSFGQNVTASATAFVQVYVPTADISFSKTPSATKVVAGSSVSYLYNVTNTGETALTGGIYDDVFGSVGSYVDLQPGGWVGFNVTHVITANTTNVATAYGVDSFGQNVTASATAFVQVLQPAISVDKTGSPAIQLAQGTITWNVTVSNTGDVPLTGINVTDTRHGYLGSAGTLNPGQTIFFVIVETELPPDIYCDTATAVGAYAGGIVSDWGDATCVVLPECIVKLLPDVNIDIDCTPDGIAAEVNVTFMNSTHLTVSALKSGSCIDYTVTYDAETDLNHVSNSIESQDPAQTQLLLMGAAYSTSQNEPPPSNIPSCQDHVANSVDSDSVVSYSSTWSTPLLGVHQQSTPLDENCRVEGISSSSDIGELGVIQGGLLALFIALGTSPWWATTLLSIRRSIKKYVK